MLTAVFLWKLFFVTKAPQCSNSCYRASAVCIYLFVLPDFTVSAALVAAIILQSMSFFIVHTFVACLVFALVTTVG